MTEVLNVLRAKAVVGQNEDRFVNLIRDKKGLSLSIDTSSKNARPIRAYLDKEALQELIKTLNSMYWSM